MSTLQAVWAADGRLHLWAEDAASYEALSEPALGASEAPRAHPFAAVPAIVSSLLDALADAATPISGVSEELAVRLPTRASLPPPSPALPVTPPPNDGLRDPLETWLVPTIVLAPDQSLDLLVSLAEGGRTAGAPLHFLARCAFLALELVARGRAVPVLREPRVGRFEARWEPAPGSSDLARLHVLARAMPGIVLASGEGLDSAARRATLEAIVAAFVDVSARASAAGTDAASLAEGGADVASALLRALCSPDAELVGDPTELRTMAGALDAWRIAARPAEGPFRTLFRLAEPLPEISDPEAADAPALRAVPDDWRLEILVGPRDDPSLTVEAADVAANRAVLASAAGGADPEEALLVELARASRLYTPLSAALMAARPEAIALDTAGAYAFLREGGPLLAEAGFGVLLPGWWRSRRRSIGLRLHARSRAGATRTSVGPGFSEASIIDYDWRIALGDVEISEADLRAIAALKSPLVELRGQWVEVRSQEVTTALRAVSRPAAARTMTIAELIGVVSGLRAAPGGLEVQGVEADGWLGVFLEGGDDGSRATSMATPADFEGVLRPYQERGLG